MVPIRRTMSVRAATAATVVAVALASPHAQTGGAERGGRTRVAARSVERVWPDPPAQARIRFVTSLAPQTSARRSLLRRLWTAVSGGSDAPAMAQPYGMAMGPLGRL